MNYEKMNAIRRTTEYTAKKNIIKLLSDHDIFTMLYNHVSDKRLIDNDAAILSILDVMQNRNKLDVSLQTTPEYFVYIDMVEDETSDVLLNRYYVTLRGDHSDKEIILLAILNILYKRLFGVAKLDIPLVYCKPEEMIKIGFNSDLFMIIKINNKERDVKLLYANAGSFIFSFYLDGNFIRHVQFIHELKNLINSLTNDTNIKS